MARLTELPSSPTPSPPTSPPPAQASPAPAAAAASTAQPADPALSEAQDLKTRANALFDAKRYEEAIALYADAVAALPPRPVPVPAAESKPDADENQPGRDAASSDATQREGGEKAVVGDTTTEPERTAEKSDGAEPAATATPAPRREDEGVTALRTTCYANQAAAYLKVEMWEQAREAASQGECPYQATTAEPSPHGVYARPVYRGLSTASPRIDSLIRTPIAPHPSRQP